MKIAKSKAALIQTQPFFASILLGFPMISDESVKTMATNGAEIRFNPAFIDSLTQEQVIFTLAHETLHCVFQHMFRRGSRNHNKWNIAADYIINDLLVKEHIGAMPKGVLFNPALVAQGKNTTEGVYDLLPDTDKDKKPGDDGGSMDDCQDSPGDSAAMSEAESKMKVKIVQASNAAKMQGKLSGNIARLVSDLTRTKTDWRAVLRRFMSERTKSDWSFSKPKRRFLADDICLPGLVGEAMGAVMVAVDCSGSVDAKLLNSFGAEIRAIIADVKPSIVHVLYFDSKIVKTETFGPDDSVTLSPCGGGGTAFSPIWRHIEEQSILPMACIVLTDLYCSDFGDCPAYPVLFASTARQSAPFGEILKIEENQ